MEIIKEYVEALIRLCGVAGPAVPVVRHVALVIVTLLLAWLSGVLCKRIVLPLIHKVTARTTAVWDDILLNDRVLLTACRIVPALVIWQFLPMVFFQFHLVREVLERLTAVYITIMMVRLITVFISAFAQLETSHSLSVRQYIKTFCGVLKIVVIFIAVIVTVGIVFGKNPMSLLAGLGATSAVLMLVFKDTIEGLVAGIRLTSNEMVKKGDWITVPSTTADGVVEEISLTTVKVRNFDNTIVTVSPMTLVNGSFQNWKGMQQSSGRRVKRIVFFDFRSVKAVDDELRNRLLQGGYFSAEEMEGEDANIGLFRKYFEKHLAARKEVNENLTIMVREMEATQCGLPLEFYFFLRDREWINYEHQLATIIERIYVTAALFGLKIYEQYPEQ